MPFNTKEDRVWSGIKRQAPRLRFKTKTNRECLLELKHVKYALFKRKPSRWRFSFSKKSF